jgi:endoglucanase
MELLEQLSNLHGVSGDEGEVRRFLGARLRDRVDELSSDPLGNAIAIKRPQSEGGVIAGLRVMVTAHMDEVGLMITDIDNNGLLHFAKVGGVNERVLPASAVLVGAKRVPGVIGMKPIHLLRPDERQRIPEITSLTIDIGASNKEEAERLVKKGDYASFATTFTNLGSTVRGKAFDDRAGCAILTELLDDSYPFTFCGVFASQEEVGSRGATVATYRLAPHIVIALEGTVCDDLPKKKDVSHTSVLGGGPVITVMDKSLISDRMLVDLLRDTAHAHNIPFQIKQPMVGSTDAGAAQTIRAGVRAVVVAVPCRYIHSPASIASIEDYNNTLALLRHALTKLGTDQQLVEQLLRGYPSGFDQKEDIDD